MRQRPGRLPIRRSPEIVFIGGRLPLNERGEVQHDGDVETQTRLVMSVIERELRWHDAAGRSTHPAGRSPDQQPSKNGRRPCAQVPTADDHGYQGVHGVPEFAVGIFLFFADPSSNSHLLRNNIFASDQANVQRVGTAAAVD
jgi:hypothetical protein